MYRIKIRIFFFFLNVIGELNDTLLTSVPDFCAGAALGAFVVLNNLLAVPPIKHILVLEIKPLFFVLKVLTQIIL